MKSQGQFYLACELIKELTGNNQHLATILLENTRALIESTARILEHTIQIIQETSKTPERAAILYLLTPTIDNLITTLQGPENDN